MALRTLVPGRALAVGGSERGAVERYGRTGVEWEALEAAGWEFLVSQARLDRTTSYTEMNTVLARRTGVREFDFDLDGERHAMGEMLGWLSERSFGLAGCWSRSSSSTSTPTTPDRDSTISPRASACCGPARLGTRS